MVAAGVWLQIAGMTVACALIGLGAGALLLRLLRTRTVTLHLLVASVAALGAVAAAVMLTSHRMLLSEHDSAVVLVVVLLSVPAGAGVAMLLGRSIRRGSRNLATSAADLGTAAYVQAPAPVTSELRTLAQAIDNAHRRLDDAHNREAVLEQGRRELVEWMSHDLRTPLAGMRAMVEALEDGIAAGETVGRYHRQLRIEVDRMSEMVADLFELSRIGSLRLHLERVGAADLVEEALASAYPMARAKGVRLVSAGGGVLPVRVDTTEFGRVLRNLLLNAIRHTPSDGTISVRAETDGGHVALSVADTCGGIPPEDLGRVFDTAFRGNGARTTAADQRGGLGLAIARGIVEAHAGDISVVNLGGGCRFLVRLPVAAE